MTQISEIKDGPTNHNLLPQVITLNEPAPSRAASELAQMIQEAQANLALVLERVSIATKRGLDDAVGAGSGSGEPVGGTRDFTQNMLDKLGGGGSMKIPDGKDEHGHDKTKDVPRPLERQDESRRHLALLVASVEAAHAWSTKAKSEMFQLTPLSQEKAKLLLGDGPSTRRLAHSTRSTARRSV